MDLVVHDGRNAVIIECKVNDVQKVYQLEKYHNYWLTAHGVEPAIFWLTRRHVVDMPGQEAFLTRLVSWNELHDFFYGYLSRATTSAAQRDTAEFLNYLKNSRILLDTTEKAGIIQRDKGVSGKHAFALLEEIASHFPDCEAKPDKTNELPYRLLIGRQRWADDFGDKLVKKVRVFLEPDPSMPAGFFLWPRICLYNWENYLGIFEPEAKKQAHFAERCPRWTSVCSRAGLILFRNAPGKTRRSHNVPMVKPYKFDASIKVLLAEEPKEKARTLSTFKDDDVSIVENGVQRVGAFLEIVDRFRG